MTMRDAGPAPDLGGLSVLLVEDNVTNQLVAGEMLRSMGARVAIASDGIEALEALEGELFDLLLVDIEMPRLSGLDVIRRVRGGPAPQAGRPIIALTAYAMREHREKIAEAGADGLIAKPIPSIHAFGAAILAHAGPRSRGPEAGAGAASGAVSGDLEVREDIFAALADSVGPRVMAELLGKVVEDLAASERLARQGAASGDMAAVRRATHNLISVAGSIGGVGVQEAAEAMNGLARDGAAEAVAARLPALSAGIAALSRFVEGRRTD